MRFGDLTYLEIRELAEADCIAVVPTGCIEQQGLHLPVDFDIWFSEGLCLAAARRAQKDHRVNSVVLPALPFGPTAEHRGFGSGYVHIPQDVHERVVASILESLAEQGFRRIVVWQGCSQHALEGVVARFNEEHAGRSRASLPEQSFRSAWCRAGGPCVPSGHADSFATSIALYLRPEAVRVALIGEPQCEPVEWDDPELDFSRYSRTGVIGDPTHASAELGKKLWCELVRDLARLLQEVAEEEV